MEVPEGRRLEPFGQEAARLAAEHVVVFVVFVRQAAPVERARQGLQLQLGQLRERLGARHDLQQPNHAEVRHERHHREDDQAQCPASLVERLGDAEHAHADDVLCARVGTARAIVRART